MPIVDITGFGNDEIEKMQDIRLAIQQTFQHRWGFKELETTSVNFFVDPSVESSPEVHVMARVYTKQFMGAVDGGRDAVCWEVQGILERFGGHVYNEAFPPGYSSMCGRPNPNFRQENS